MSVVYSAAKTLLCVMCVSSKRRQSRCALVNGVQTCALPIGTPKKIADNEEKGFYNDLTPVSKGVRKNIHARQYHSEKNEFQQGRSLLKALEEVAAESDEALKEKDEKHKKEVAQLAQTLNEFKLQNRSEEQTSELQSIMRI